VLLLLGRLSGSDINAARHLNSLTKVALQSWIRLRKTYDKHIFYFTCFFL